MHTAAQLFEINRFSDRHFWHEDYDKAEEDRPRRVDLYQVAAIVRSYVRNHQVAADQLAGLIVAVYRALSSPGDDTPVKEPLRPAVPIRSSIQQDYIVCLECGFRAQMLRHHLRVAHGLDIADYRARWQLPASYPVTAPNYSARRSRTAKQTGLGRRRASIEPAPPPEPPVTRRGRRPRPRR